MTMALSYLFVAVNPKLVLTVTVGDFAYSAPSDMILSIIRRNLGI